MLQRYADGRKICDCGEAYYRTDCPGGCPVNRITARDDIARRILSKPAEPRPLGMTEAERLVLLLLCDMALVPPSQATPPVMAAMQAGLTHARAKLEAESYVEHENAKFQQPTA